MYDGPKNRRTLVIRSSSLLKTKDLQPDIREF